MRTRFFTLIFSLLLGSGIMAQGTGRIGTHESIGKWNPSTTTSSFSNINEGRTIAQEIIDVVGLKPNFEIREANIPNAAAVTYSGKRYVLYNPKFIQQLEKTTGTKWAGISVLAHEIGHHLNGHTITATGSQPTLELESDEFSGFVLRKMGASLAESQAAMKTLASVQASKTHPGQYDRLTAIADGWEKADAQAAGRKYVARTRTPQQTQQTVGNNTRRNSAPIDARSIIGEVRFNSDKSIAYYVTTAMNLVRVQGNQLSVIGKLATLNNRQYPYVIYDQSTQLLVDTRGNIITRQGQQVGTLIAKA